MVVTCADAHVALELDHVDTGTRGEPLLRAVGAGVVDHDEDVRPGILGLDAVEHASERGPRLVRQDDGRERGAYLVGGAPSFASLPLPWCVSTYKEGRPVTMRRRVVKLALRTVGRKPSRFPNDPRLGGDPAPPDFVGIGAMKSGTTWWESHIAAHPDVVPMRKKELHFFDRFHDVPFADSDRLDYWTQFTRDPGTVAGEWTPRYMFDFWTMPLLRLAAPDAKLLVVLRDPVERFLPGSSTTSPGARAGAPHWPTSTTARGLYHEQLTNVLRHFPREQLLVLQFERCIADTRTQLATTYRFLGLDDSFVPDLEAGPRNRAREPKPPLPPHVAAELRERYRDDMARLFADFSELDPDLWSSSPVPGVHRVTPS